ncbi:contact-dependent growth inhibition system immunity protein [Streptomyces sp. NPDC056480]|uniref:contact-dependent growth inhibition system immunity protein n=1 Tax=Streptomyces sp. NPDC056480 TaxID=3345833 RepID=UPI0036D1C92D
MAGYLRQTWRTRPWAIAVAAEQLRVYADSPPGRLRLRLRLGEYDRLPDVGPPPEEIRDRLTGLAGRLYGSLANGQAPPPAAPATSWEWRARFPAPAQLLGGWFSQDVPDEFGDHEAALADYPAGTGRGLVARLAGELHDLLALGRDEDGPAEPPARRGERPCCGGWGQGFGTVSM